MWNRPAVLLWVSVRIQEPGRHRFTLGIPLPLFLLYQWIDTAEDALVLLRLFPHAQRAAKRFSVREILAAIRPFMRELFRTGPTELADIDVEQGARRVQVRCRLH